MSDSYDIDSKRDFMEHSAISDTEWQALKLRLAESSFRSRFKLRRSELKYLAERGFAVVEGQCRNFIRDRLAPAQPFRDGNQTPMRGHPGFVAQHATGCCCRGCLEKWHGIPQGRRLSEEEINRIVSILMRWIAEHSAGMDEFPVTPDLF